MDTNLVTQILREGIWVAIKLGGPMLVLSMVVGVLMAIFQAVTQIHEQTLTFLPKLVVIGVILVINGSNMLRALQDFTRQIFDMIAR